MAIRDSNMLKLGEFVHYKTKPLFFFNCLAFESKHQMLRGGFNDNFSGYHLITDSIRHAVKC